MDKEMRKSDRSIQQPNKRNIGLGRGLDALFKSDSQVQETETKANSEEIVLIDINDLIPNRKQARKNFDEAKLEELAESIKNQGVIQPLIVAADDMSAPYKIVAGERRWRAARMAGLTEVPCLVRKLDEVTVQKQSLIENVVREDLNSIEEAEAYEELMRNYDIRQEDLANALGKSRSNISNTMRLLQLSDSVQTFVRDGKLSAGHARALLALSDSDQEKVSQQIIENKLSVRQTEALVKDMLEPSKKRPKKKNNVFKLHAKAVEEKMTRAMGTKVRISPRGQKGEKGSVIISYSSPDELERIIDYLSYDR